jgi:hypothetical protein
MAGTVQPEAGGKKQIPIDDDPTRILASTSKFSTPSKAFKECYQGYLSLSTRGLALVRRSTRPVEPVVSCKRDCCFIYLLTVVICMHVAVLSF